MRAFSTLRTQDAHVIPPISSARETVTLVAVVIAPHLPLVSPSESELVQVNDSDAFARRFPAAVRGRQRETAAGDRGGQGTDSGVREGAKRPGRTRRLGTRRSER
ncbi:hypothetical protein GCM10023074_65260 [Microbispora amethystogenes]|uniref:Uncharacterized protein n=1 Tax=Microbispora amethystogenes TaxID=1427754 RepID=A0ABQ4FMA0_9ACTN|nr:hypothetical protein Mam01_61050 [Microbispora amethystogenes]